MSWIWRRGPARPFVVFAAAVAAVLVAVGFWFLFFLLVSWEESSLKTLDRFQTFSWQKRTSKPYLQENKKILLLPHLDFIF